jgi:hypothetical protein
VHTLVALALDLSLPLSEGSDEEIAKQVQRCLSELTPETLWVVDDVGDLNLVNELSAAAGSFYLRNCVVMFSNMLTSLYELIR